MDAVDFVKEWKRACKSFGGCASCTIQCGLFPRELTPEEVVKTIEDWTKGNPSKTRQSEFLKLFPNARMTNGALKIFPCAIDSSYEEHTGECVGKDCGQCRKEYWLEEIE